MKIKQKVFNKENAFLLGVSAVPINIWTIYYMLELIPAWIKSNVLWDFIGSIAYTLRYAILDILVIFFTVIVLRLIIPDKWAKDKFLAFGFLYLAEFSTFVLLLQFVDSLFWQKRLLLIAFFGVLVFIFLMVHFIPVVNRVCQFLADRFAVLGFFFMIFNILSILIVLIRNVF